jgi:hypothetical protein
MNNRCSLLGKPQWLKLNSLSIDLIRTGLDQINSNTSYKYNIPTSLWGRYIIGMRKSNIISIRCYTKTRPISYRLIALLENESKLLYPGLNTEDYFSLINALGLGDIQNIVTLYSLCRLSREDYGVYEKGCMPQQILTVEDAKANGIVYFNDYDMYINDELSLWWQKWGGFLYSFKFNPDRRDASYQKIDESIGYFEKLPIGLLR